MKVLVVGDFCQRYRVDEVVRQHRFGVLFDEVKPIIESADYSIVNFEFPIVLATTKPQPITKCGPNLRGTIESVEAVKYAGFECCTLANNHILDQGEQCCLDTKLGLEKSGVDTVGVGRNVEEAGEILYKNVNGETLAIINCCEHEFTIATTTSAGANPLNPIQQFYKIQEARSHADYVLVIVHGGHEMYQLPSPRMQEAYRFFIDAGADAVVNHHQHCYSGYEIYNGKPIFYGLGNFCFDSKEPKDDDIWNKGYMVEINFSKVISYRIYPYRQCCESPKVELLSENTFGKSIQEFNAIISSPSQLAQSASNYYASCARFMGVRFEPINNRYVNALQLRGYLPSFIKRNRLVTIQNYVLCESHRDKLDYYFKSYDNNR